MSEKPSFFAELKRRHVFRVGVAYVVVSWLLLQLGAIIFPTLHAPSWCEAVLLAFLVLGFPVAVLLAWAFEVTPEGVRRTESVEDEEARPADHRRHVGRVLNIGIIVVLAAAVGILLWRQLGMSSKPQVVASHAVQAVQAARTSSERTVAAASVPTPHTVIPAKSIAVLPFANMSADKNNKYFADGMQDLILTKLADIGDLKVIARTSTMQYGSHPENLSLVGKQLGVATILEGSVQKAGDQVLINVQLIDAKTDAHIWAQSYTRTLKNVFGVEGEVAEKIAAALKAKLSPAESKRLAKTLSNDPTANDLYLRGEFFTTRGVTNFDTVAYRKAIALYRQALARDPSFALARARLSYAESGLVWFGGAGSDTQELIADAVAQAKQALAEQPDLTAAHLALGYVYYWDQQNYAAALKEFAAALKLRPNDADAIFATGAVLRRQGRFDAAIDAMQQALKLDPRNSSTAEQLAETMAVVRRYVEAERMVQRALALDPDNIPAKVLYSNIILMSSGDVGSALAAAQGDPNLLRGWRSHLLTFQRKYREAITLFESIPETPGVVNYKYGPKALRLADLYRLAGDSERARTLYAQALPQSHAQLAALAGNAMMLGFVWNHIAAAELGLGKTDDALAALAKSQVLITQSGDHYFMPWVNEMNASLYAQAGRADLAVPLLAKALAAPGGGEAYSPLLLKIDPAWDAIRNTPEFQALLKKYAKYKPATVPTVGSAPTAATAPAS